MEETAREPDPARKDHGGPRPCASDLLARKCRIVHLLPQSQQELWGFPILRLGLVTVAG